MTRKIIFTLFFILSTICNAQITFEKGYFINNAGQKTDCLIKNLDWYSNPTKFIYKLSENEEEKSKTIKTVKEFRIFGASSYKRETIKMDRSSASVEELSQSSQPEYKEETLFLKTLIEGDASLYVYVEKNLTRFFFKMTSSPIEQLVFKEYLKEDNRTIGSNNYFKQQLWNALKCEKLSRNTFAKLAYDEGKLIKVFEIYNHCENTDFIGFERKKQVAFDFTVKAGIQQSAFSISRDFFNQTRTIDFGSETGLRIGVEAELILPFYKNKWSLSVAPTYQSYKGDQLGEGTLRDITVTADYKSIEFPVSIRHYLFLNKNSKFFVNGSYAFNIPLSSKITFEKRGGDLVIKNANGHIALGVGFMYKKYSLEIRQGFGHDLLTNFLFWDSNYTITSLNFGYKIF